jgi:diguanylate cyclase (GGDEF)-like protein
MPDSRFTAPTLSTQCLLIVDDDPSAILLLSRVLEGEARIVFATSGEAALRQIREHRPDLVLMDASMPGLDGLETCRRIRSDPCSADVPVIIVTAHADIELETRALALGAVDFVHKPVHPPVVRARVRTHLALRQQSDALRRLAAVDAFTGLANRRAFDAALDQEWRRAMRHRHALSLLLVDVDHFKRYNDLHGHRAGDACLCQVAGLIAAAARRAGELPARYSGQAFAVLLPHAALAPARAFAQSLCAAFEAAALPHGDSPVAPHVTASIGVAHLVQACEHQGHRTRSCHGCGEFPPCRAAPERLVNLAGQALQQAKHEGRARVACREAVADRGAGADR